MYRQTEGQDRLSDGAKQLRDELRARRLSYRQAEFVSGVDAATINKVVLGRLAPSPAAAIAFQAHFGVLLSSWGKSHLDRLAATLKAAESGFEAA